jgi:replicative DNA helicase
MNRDEAKAIVKSYLPEYLTSKGLSLKGKFNCLNPDHADRTPSMQYDSKRNKVHCFSCGADYDIFELIGIEFGLTDSKAKFDKAYEMYEIDVDGLEYTQSSIRKPIVNQEETYTIKPLPEEEEIDFSKELEEAHEALLKNKEALKHYQDRGLSLDLIKKYKLGYATKYNSLLKAELQSRSLKQKYYNYVLPYLDAEGKGTYFIAEISDRNQIDKYNGKYIKIPKRVGQIFNERYLKKDTPEVIFICEGVYDALSVEEVGGKAIAFVGTAHRRFISLCNEFKPDTTFVISLDNDSAGNEAIKAVKKGLDYLKIPYIVKQAKNKDFNEDLMKDRKALEDLVMNTTKEAKNPLDEAKEEYLKESAGYHMQDFINGIKESAETKAIPTGFNYLDSVLEGGLYEGLYTIGAGTSTGKTTYIMQIVDNIAKAGEDVLVIALEMARNELMARSISRLTYEDELQSVKHYAKKIREITTYNKYSKYTKEEREHIQLAMNAYAEYANHIFIHEGVGNIGVKEVKELIEKHIKYTGNKPVVVVDFIQILAPYNERYSDKQNTDKAVLELKRLSREHKIPIIAISSTNRTSYNDAPSLSMFKESGSLEFLSDVALGMAFDAVGTDNYDFEKESNKDPKEIQVAVLKNRNGERNIKLKYEYKSSYFYFKETGWERITYKKKNKGGSK